MGRWIHSEGGPSQSRLVKPGVSQWSVGATLLRSVALRIRPFGVASFGRVAQPSQTPPVQSDTGQLTYVQGCVVCGGCVCVCVCCLGRRITELFQLFNLSATSRGDFRDRFHWFVERRTRTLGTVRSSVSPTTECVLSLLMRTRVALLGWVKER